jgi:hypothetical protein
MSETQHNYSMTIIRNDDFQFPFTCRAYTPKQAGAYARKLFGRYVMVRDLREVTE